MSTRLPVIAAIPNYNMAKGLKRLLPQLLKQDYDHIYVLDDASTDDSEAVVKSFGKNISFIKSTKNKGSGAARNLILAELSAPTLIHFIDADVSVVSENNASIIRELGIDDTVGFVSGLVIDKTGLQSLWNYGPKRSLPNTLNAVFLSFISRIESHSRGTRNFSGIYTIFRSWPNPHVKPRRRHIFWACEANLVIRSDTFALLGGFDEHIREDDILPLAYTAKTLGLTNIFDPRLISRTHDDIAVRMYNRRRAFIQAEIYIIKTYGKLIYWLFPFLEKQKNRR